MARSYKRDKNGRFSGGGGGGAGGGKKGGSKAPKPPTWSKAMKEAKAAGGGKKGRSPRPGQIQRAQVRAATIAARSGAAVKKLPLTRSGNYLDPATMKKGNRLLQSEYTAEKALKTYASAAAAKAAAQPRRPSLSR